MLGMRTLLKRDNHSAGLGKEVIDCQMLIEIGTDKAHGIYLESPVTSGHVIWALRLGYKKIGRNSLGRREKTHHGPCERTISAL